MENLPNKASLFPKSLDFLHKVKYGGAVGKMTVISVSAILILGMAMVSGWGKEYVIGGAIIGVLLVVVLSFRAIRKTLEKHPELAQLPHF